VGSDRDMTESRTCRVISRYLRAALVLPLSVTLLSAGSMLESSVAHPPETSKTDSQGGRDSQTDVAEFRTGKEGRLLLIPVDWRNETLHFLLDTGAARTIFDLSLVSKLGQPIARTKVRTAVGLVGTSEFKCPKATVGGFQLNHVKSVLSLDLRPIRQATGENVRGILGADFLQTAIVTIDFDQARVHLSVPNGTRAEPPGDFQFPMIVDRSGRPHVISTIGDQEMESLLLDTGATFVNVRTLETHESFLQGTTL